MTRKMWTRILATLACVALSATMLAGTALAQDKIVVEGSTTVEPIATAFAEYYMSKNPKVNITVSGTGSSNGAKALIQGACHVADMSRGMKDKEFKAAVEAGVMPIAHVVAMDGLAIVLHPSNPIKAFTVDQLRDIYTGKVKNWKELGGADMEIVKVGRDTSSGTYETFHNLVMGKEKVSSDVEVVGSNGQARQKVLTTKSAIAYVGLGFTKGVKAVPVDGIEATAETINSGEYPIARPLFMWTNGYPKLGSPVHHFVTLHLTEKGQEIVEEKGFVPVTRY